MSSKVSQLEKRPSQIRLDEAKKKLAEYDFVRFTLTDYHGMQRGRTVTSKCVPGRLDAGLNIYGGAFAVGPNHQVPVIKSYYNLEGNASFRADPDAIYPLPWAAEGEVKVAEILGDPWMYGKPMDMAPRYIARKQLARLEDMGMTMKSSFELEFFIQDEDDKPLVNSSIALTTLGLAKYEKLLYGMIKNIEKAGVDFEAVNAEYAESQFEITLDPVFGMKGIDNVVFAKSSIKELCQQKGYRAVFMSKPYKKLLELGNGFHFNHSLWDLSGKVNKMFDANDPKTFSSIMRHWIAGLQKHGPAIAALMCPTVNCYRRFHKPWAPHKSDWGLDDRAVSYRVKSGSPSSTYVENRIPSGSCNPYLAVAATVAAGLDGIEKKMELSEERYPDSPELPHSLEEALCALENNEVIVNAFGKTFVEWFCIIKREIEIKELGEVDLQNLSDESLAKERDMYLIAC